MTRRTPNQRHLWVEVIRVIVPNYILGPSNCIASSGGVRPPDWISWVGEKLLTRDGRNIKFGHHLMIETYRNLEMYWTKRNFWFELSFGWEKVALTFFGARQASKGHVGGDDLASSIGNHMETRCENVRLTYGYFQKFGFFPQIIQFDRVFHYKPSILGYPYFWKHLYIVLVLIHVDTKYSRVQSNCCITVLLHMQQTLQICFVYLWWAYWGFLPIRMKGLIARRLPTK